MVTDVLTKDVSYGTLMELYADDLVLCGESLNEVMDRYVRWKNVVEEKGLRVNVNKKQKLCSYYLGKVVFPKWILVVSVVSGLVVILLDVRNGRSGFIVVFLTCLDM